MEVMCPNCREILESDGFPGEIVSCPGCGTEFALPDSRRRVCKSAEKRMTTSSMVACYIVGILFGLIGVFIASATDGQKGASYAARGCLIHFALGIGLYFVAKSLML